MCDNSSELQHNTGRLALGSSEVSKGQKLVLSSSRILWGLRLVPGRVVWQPQDERWELASLYWVPLQHCQLLNLPSGLGVIVTLIGDSLGGWNGCQHMGAMLPQSITICMTTCTAFKIMVLIYSLIELNSIS